LPLRGNGVRTATARFGDQVPVPVTTFAAIATGGVAQQPVTSFEYKNVGINIDVTPRVHQDGDITLQLNLEISQVGAPGYGGGVSPCATYSPTALCPDAGTAPEATMRSTSAQRSRTRARWARVDCGRSAGETDSSASIHRSDQRYTASTSSAPAAKRSGSPTPV